MPTADLPEVDPDNQDINCNICLEKGKEKTKSRFESCFGDEFDDACSCKDFAPVCMKSVHYKSTKYRDILIKMSLLCEETELTSFVDSIDDLEILLIQANPVTNSLLEKAFTATRYCDDIETVDWMSASKKIQVRSNQSY